MSYRLIIKREALADMQEAYQYYEAQQNGLGEQFLSRLQERFDALSEHPEYYSYIDQKYILRDVTMAQFPFVIVYEIAGTEVIVYAICSTHKHPEYKRPK